MKYGVREEHRIGSDLFFIYLYFLLADLGIDLFDRSTITREKRALVEFFCLFRINLFSAI